MTIPQRGTSPVKRLTSLALALSTDGVREDALAEVAARMHACSTSQPSSTSRA